MLKAFNFFLPLHCSGYLVISLVILTKCQNKLFFSTFFFFKFYFIVVKNWMIMCEFCYVSRDLVMEMMRLMLIMI
jgi:hypothetical protein